MYEKYTYKLLFGVAFDVDNQIFLLCYAFVDLESADNWTWVLKCLPHYVMMDQHE